MKNYLFRLNKHESSISEKNFEDRSPDLKSARKTEIKTVYILTLWFFAIVTSQGHYTYLNQKIFLQKVKERFQNIYSPLTVLPSYVKFWKKIPRLKVNVFYFSFSRWFQIRNQIFKICVEFFFIAILNFWNQILS